MKSDVEAKIRNYFESVIRVHKDDRFYVLNLMLAYLHGIDAMDGFLSDEFARAMNDLEGWYYFGKE